MLQLPYPYLTTYSMSPSHQFLNNRNLFQLLTLQSNGGDKPLVESLQNRDLFFSELLDLESSQRPPDSNNSQWARARRSPSSVFTWANDTAPTLAQLWLVIYMLLTARPEVESFRIQLHGTQSENVSAALRVVLLAVPHPPKAIDGSSDIECVPTELVVLRSTFWQGAGSPFGPRPVWVPETGPSASFKALSAYPLVPLDHTTTTASQSARVQARHPRRAAKPRPGSVIYSRYISHLKETFSMVALDCNDEEHLNLFHQWQNDPRVSQGWNETGTLDQHREYLRRTHEDPHLLAVLAQFDGTHFAYFEIYWAKEDHLGAYYDAGDFDRGRHSLVGDVRFRGPHRVGAWWSSLMHYIFLDDPRTMHVVGEPKATNSSVLLYDLIHGFGLDKFVDLPHKRSAFMRCSRERFFQLSPLGESYKAVGGTGVVLSPKL